MSIVLYSADVSLVCLVCGEPDIPLTIWLNIILRIQDIDDRTKELIEDIIRLYPYYASTLPNVNNNESIPIYPSSKDIYGQAYYSIDEVLLLCKELH